jgi:hypothetical protein
MRTFKFVLGLLGLASVCAAQGIVERQISPNTLRKLQGGMLVYNATGGDIAVNSLVYANSWSEGQIGLPTIDKADADGTYPANVAQFVIRDSACVSATVCRAEVYASLTGQNTNGSTIGNPVYLSTTAGSFTLTKPTSPTANVQIVGRVRAVSSTLGRIDINLRNAQLPQYGFGMLQEGIGGVRLIRASTNLANGDLVYLSSYHAATGAFIAALADADVAAGQATYVVTSTIASGSTGYAYKAATISSISTTGSTVGNPVYLTVTGTTTNTWSLTPPSGADDQIQIVGRVTVVGTGAADGAFAVDLTGLPDHVPTLARGYILRGSSTVVPEAYDANDTGKILVGDNTDLASVAVSNDATLAANGALTIATGAVTSGKILDGTIANADIADQTIQTSKLSPRGASFNFRDPPFIFLADNSGIATGAATEVDQLLFPDGLLYLYYNEQVGGPAIPSFTVTADGINVQQDAADNDDTQFYAPGQVGERQMYTGQTDAFYVKGTFTITTVAGIDPLCIGIKTPQANADIDAFADVGTAYGGAGEEVVAFCVTAGDIEMITNVAAAGSVPTDTTDDWSDGETHTLEIDVSAAGVVSYKLDGAAPTASPVAPLTITADTFFPFFLQAQTVTTSAAYVSLFESGLQ